MSSTLLDEPRETPDIETSSERYASRFAGKVGQYLLGVQQNGLLALLDAKPISGIDLVDVGGGHAQLCQPLLSKGYRVNVLGSDQSCATRVYLSCGDAVTFHQGNLLAMPFNDGEFNVVTSVRLISHIEDQDKLVSELCRIARQTIIIDYPTYVSVNALSLVTFPLKKHIEKNTRTYYTFWDAQIRTMFAKHGFTAVASYRQFVLPMALHRLFGAAWLLQKTEQCLRWMGVTNVIGNPVLIRFDRKQA